MTDNEIIKALEVCTSELQDCVLCQLLDNCDPLVLDGQALDLINRQQAEIERLKIENQSLRSAANSYKIHYDEARAEAVKEFAYRLKERQQTFIGDEYTYKFIYLIEIDNLVKEYEKGR